MNTIPSELRLSRVILFGLTLPLLAANPLTTNTITPGPVPVNMVYQSRDGGQTWEDISYSLPEDEQPEDFFAGDSEVYMRYKDVMYRSKTRLKTPIWEKEKMPGASTSLAFNRSGVMAYNYDGDIYQKISVAGTWLPRFTNFRAPSMRTIFETSDGTLFVGSDAGLFRSVDSGRSWKQVQNGGWAMEFVEAEGVLIATSQRGIIRSADNGEHWETVVKEGGVGIDVERIDGGFAAIAYNTTTMSRRIHISMDQGKTWKAIDEGLRPSMSISSIKQVGQYLVCGHPDGIFRSSDLGKTWEFVHDSVDKVFRVSVSSPDNGRVFKLYVSGNVLYAIAKNSGC